MTTTTLITGNTYPHRQALYKMGGRWNASQKGWEVPSDKADEARALVNGKGQVAREGRSLGSSRYRSNLYVLSSGAELYRNKAGRCEDAPCCGCCNF